MNYTIEDHPLRIIALDSLIDGEVCGIVIADQREWLDAEFSKAPDRPTIVNAASPAGPHGRALARDVRLARG
ncbi:MAG: hypothetical protein VX416_07215 [Pseudomonadota bacterium]|nr:hypothetical protein [Pseudomonadota bacterium]